MSVDALRKKTPKQVHDDVSSFAARYIEDWESWMQAAEEQRPQLFGHILRKWQATRPRAMRRLRNQAQHGAPFLDDLLRRSSKPLQVVEDLTLLAIAFRTAAQDRALVSLWKIFLHLPTSGAASCVGITKAILLLTDGRIGPAFDSKVRKQLGVGPPPTPAEWLGTLQQIAEDIAAFESVHGPLTDAVPRQFAQLGYGRLYDMALGPR